MCLLDWGEVGYAAGVVEDVGYVVLDLANVMDDLLDVVLDPRYMAMMIHALHPTTGAQPE